MNFFFILSLFGINKGEWTREEKSGHLGWSKCFLTWRWREYLVIIFITRNNFLSPSACVVNKEMVIQRLCEFLIFFTKRANLDSSYKRMIEYFFKIYVLQNYRHPVRFNKCERVSQIAFCPSESFLLLIFFLQWTSLGEVKLL